MTEPAQAWAEAFVAAQSELPTIAKDKTANTGTYSYRYADLSAIVDKVRPILKKHGLAFTQDVRELDGRVAVSTLIVHVSGHLASFGPVVLPAGNTPQAAGSAITYARRYGLTAALGLVTDEDDDAELAQKATKKRPAGGQGKAEGRSRRPPAGPVGEESGQSVAGPGEAPRPASGSSSAPTRVFPKTPDSCPHRAQLVPYEGEQVCSGCGLPDALIETGGGYE